MNYLRRYWDNWGRPIIADTVPKNRENTETFLNLSNGTSTCFICQVTLPRLPEDKRKAAQKAHKRTFGHKTILVNVIKNGICVVHSLMGWQLFCRICQRHLRSRESIKEHILNVKHDEWFKEMKDLTINVTELLTTCPISIEKYLNSESNFAFCGVCEKNIECTHKTIQQHLTSDEHKKLLVEAILPCMGLFPIENDKMWCKICDLRLDNTVEALYKHLTEGSRHGRWLHIADLMSAQDISIKDFLTDEKELMVKCLRCDLKITPDPRNIQAHAHCESHRLRYMNYTLEMGKSLTQQRIWPSWCQWNFFTHPSCDLSFWALRLFVRHLMTFIIPRWYDNAEVLNGGCTFRSVLLQRH